MAGPTRVHLAPTPSALAIHRLSIRSSAGPTSSVSRLIAYTDGGFRGEPIIQQILHFAYGADQQEDEKRDRRYRRSRRVLGRRARGNVSARRQPSICFGLYTLHVTRNIRERLPAIVKDAFAAELYVRIVQPVTLRMLQANSARILGCPPSA